MTDRPQSPGEAPFRFGFAFDARQLMEMGDEAMLCSEAPPQSEERLIEGAARLAAASGFLGASLLNAGWTSDKLSRLLQSSANAGLVVFQSTSQEARSADQQPQGAEQEAEGEEEAAPIEVEKVVARMLADDAMMSVQGGFTQKKTDEEALAIGVAHLGAAAGLLGSALTMSPDWTPARLKALILESIVVGVDFAEQISREEPAPRPQGEVVPFLVRS